MSKDQWMPATFQAWCPLLPKKSKLAASSQHVGTKMFANRQMQLPVAQDRLGQRGPQASQFGKLSTLHGPACPYVLA